MGALSDRAAEVRQAGLLPVRIYAYIAAVVLILGAFGATYLYGRSAGTDSVRLEWEEASRVQRAREAATANEAALRLEGSREKERVVFKTITRSVDRLVDRPVYRNVCLDDDGLRLARCAIRGEGADTCKPDQPVRGTPGPDRRDGGGRLTLDYGDRSILSGLLEEAARASAGGQVATF